MSYAIMLKENQKLKLDDIDPDDTGKAKKEKSVEELQKLGEDLCELQQWLYAAQKNSVLIVLQGPDSSGKDGTIAHVMASVNPQGCAVTAFKVPSEEEQLHDFLWRVHKMTPAKGDITIFNRSHYEDVLVTRVHKLISDKEAEKRFKHIRQFEELLVDDNTIILKFYLHISKSEQEERLLAREKDTEKAYKLNPGDWQERQYWNDYRKAYEDALSATSTKDAPWYIIPANHKWFRNLAIAEAIVDRLKPYKEQWFEDLKKLGKEKKAEITQMREEIASGKKPDDDAKSDK